MNTAAKHTHGMNRRRENRKIKKIAHEAMKETEDLAQMLQRQTDREFSREKTLRSDPLRAAKRIISLITQDKCVKPLMCRIMEKLQLSQMVIPLFLTPFTIQDIGHLNIIRDPDLMEIEGEEPRQIEYERQVQKLYIRHVEDRYGDAMSDYCCFVSVYRGRRDAPLLLIYSVPDQVWIFFTQITHRRLKKCRRCNAPVETVACSECDLCRYCSHKCYEEDKEEHARICPHLQRYKDQLLEVTVRPRASVRRASL